MKMNTLLIRRTLRGLVLALAALALSSQVVRATPYASGITNKSGNIYFVLNEGGASVGVYFPDNNSTNFLGASLAAGVQHFPIGAGTNHYQIYVSKVGAGHITQINSDSGGINPTLAAQSPRGVAVNDNPNDHNFGRIYITDGVGRGVFVRNADTSDAVGYGTAYQTGGLPWVGSSYSPWRCYVGPDDTVYVASTSTLANGGFLGYMGPDLTAASSGLVFPGQYNGYSAGQNHSDIMGTPVAQGSLAQGNLVISAIDVYYTTNNSTYATPLALDTWNIGNNGGSPLPYTGMPTMGPSPIQGYFIVSDSYATTNNLYFLLDRTYYDPIPNGAAPPWALYVYTNINVAPQIAWSSGTNTIQFDGSGNPLDLFAACLGVTVSPDGQLIAAVNNVGANVLCYLTNGIPNEATLFTNIPAGGTAGSSYGSCCFDLAQNLYCVASGPSVLRVYSLGYSSTAITANDSTTTNGTFQLIIPGSTVGVTASTPQISQNHGAPTSGNFTLTRGGSAANLNQKLTVTFTLSGTATNGPQYTVSPVGVMDATGTNGTVVFAQNQTTTNITITAVNGGSLPTTTVVLTLGSGNFNPILPGDATILIQNTGPQLLFVSGVVAPTMYRAYSNDVASFTITRWGDTNVTDTVTFSTTGSTALQGTDFTAPTPTTIHPGDVTDTFTISPLNNGQLPVHNNSYTYVGNKTVVVSVGSGGGYTAGAGSATMTILDCAYPPGGTVLWSDPLTSSASNNGIEGSGEQFTDGVGGWYLTWTDNDSDNLVDYTLDFGYDLVNDPNGYNEGIALPLPPNGIGNALRLTANKVHNGTEAQAINLYPTNMAFSGNYAVRFNMYIVEGSALSTSLPSETAEGPLFGINCSGMDTNWWSDLGTEPANVNWHMDGVWYWITAWSGHYGAPIDDMCSFTGITNCTACPQNTGAIFPQALIATSFVNQFKTNCFSCVNSTTNLSGGLPANGSPLISSLPLGNWADVEIINSNNVVTMDVNKTVLFSYVNTNSVFQQGFLMLGYEEPNGEAAGTEAAAYFSNLQVVSLPPPTVLSITGITISGANVVITFTSTGASDTTASFTLESSSVVNGTYAIDTTATYTQLGPGAFQVTYPKNGPSEFYRIKHN
jgi:hypothetical protein